MVVAVHHSTTATTNKHIQKRYYDSWHSNDVSSDDNVDSIRVFPHRQKGLKKEDPCANKPLWYLKYQARLGKLSPFYECLSLHGI